MFSRIEHPIEINVILYLGGLDDEKVHSFRCRGYRVARSIRTLFPDHEIFIIEEDSSNCPRITIEIDVSCKGLSEAERVKILNVANQIRKQILEHIANTTNIEPKVTFKELS